MTRINGNRIRSAREAKGLTIGDAATLARTSESTVKRVEGSKDTSAKTLARIVAALGMSLDDAVSKPKQKGR